MLNKLINAFKPPQEQQGRLKGKKYISYNELKQRITAIPDPHHRNFIKLTYSALGRIGEIVRSKAGCKHNPPLTSSDLTYTDTHLIIQLLTEKTGNVRRVPVNRELEAWLTEPLINLAKHSTGALYDYSTRWGEMIFFKYFGTQKIHLLRSLRATHLMQGKCTLKRLEEQHVMKMGGWTNTATLHRHYSQIVIEDYLELI